MSRSRPQGPFPTILPMIGVVSSFRHPSAGLEEPLDLYLHRYVSPRTVRLAQNGGAGEEMGGASGVAAEGLPVCVTAGLVDGLVLSLTPNGHSYNYRSAGLHGYAAVVTSDEGKVWPMRLITNSVVPGRYESTRVPPIRLRWTRHVSSESGSWTEAPRSETTCRTMTRKTCREMMSLTRCRRVSCSSGGPSGTQSRRRTTVDAAPEHVAALVDSNSAAGSV